MSTNCCRAGCVYKATHHVEARVWATGYPKTSAPITARIGVPLCKRHATEACSDFDDLISEEFWSVVEGMAANAGRVAPDRASLELVPVKGLPLESAAADAARQRLN